MGLFDFLFKRKKKKNEDFENLQTELSYLKSDEEVNEVKEAKEAKKAKLATKTEAEIKSNTETKAETKSNTKTKAETKKEPKAEKDMPKAGQADFEEKGEKSRPQGQGKFEIKNTKDGRFVFNLYASNHVIIATSQTYSTSQAAINGIKSISANAAKAPIEDSTLKNYTVLPYPKWEIYTDKNNEYRFRLSASNGSCICHSQGYSSKSSCKNGIDSIIRFSQNATIDKLYLKQ